MRATAGVPLLRAAGDGRGTGNGCGPSLPTPDGC